MPRSEAGAVSVIMTAATGVVATISTNDRARIPAANVRSRFIGASTVQNGCVIL